MKNYSTYVNENKSNATINIKDYEIPHNFINSINMLLFEGLLIGIGTPKENFKIMHFSHIEFKKIGIYLVGKFEDNQPYFDRILLGNTNVYNLNEYLENLKKNFLGNLLNFSGTINKSGSSFLTDFKNIEIKNRIEFCRGNIWHYIKFFDNNDDWYDIDIKSDIILSSRIKKLENPIIDPYGEEDWGFEII